MEDVWKVSGSCLEGVCTFYVCPHILCLSPPIMSVPTFYVCPHLFCLSPSIMFVPSFTSVSTFYIRPHFCVCPHLLCLSPPILSVPTFTSVHTFYIRPHLLCLSPTIILIAYKPFSNLDRLGNVRVRLECFSTVFGQGV